MCFWEQDLLHSIFCSRWRAPEMHKKALRNVFASAYSASAVTVHQVGRRVTVPVAEVLRPRWPRSNLPRRATVSLAENLQPRAPRDKSAQRRAGVHARRNTLRSTLLSPSFYITGTVAPQERPQTSSAHRLADSSLPRRKDAEQARARPACAGRAAILTLENVRRAEDCPPYQCNCHGV